MEPHGGYFLNLDQMDARELLTWAKDSLFAMGHDAANAALLLSLHQHGKIGRVAFDAPFAYGQKGAHWYLEFPSFALELARRSDLTVHAYTFDPESAESVKTFLKGQCIDSQTVCYEEAVIPEDEFGELDEVAFAKLKARWPIGQLAAKLGVAREELLLMPKARTVWLPIDGVAPSGRASGLFPPLPRMGRITREFRALSELSES